jgi:hypothetical protein
MRKGLYMATYKYRHTFYLHSGEVIVTYSQVKDLTHLTFGEETAIIADDGKIQYTIPFFSIGYVETEEICDDFD